MHVEHNLVASLKKLKQEVWNCILVVLWVLRCVIPMMRFLFHCFLFQYCVIATIDVMVVLLSLPRYSVCWCVKIHGCWCTGKWKLVILPSQVFGGLQGKSRIHKSVIQQSRHHCVTLYLKDEYEKLALEAYFDIQRVDVLIGNRPSFECKFCGNLFKDKKIVLPQNDEFVPWFYGRWIAQNVSNNDKSWT